MAMKLQALQVSFRYRFRTYVRGKTVFLMKKKTNYFSLCIKCFFFFGTKLCSVSAQNVVSQLCVAVYNNILKTLEPRVKNMTNFVFNVYKVKSGVQNASLLQGRIVNLGIRCTRDSSGTEYFSCLIFKTFGLLSCEYILYFFFIFVNLQNAKRLAFIHDAISLSLNRGGTPGNSWWECATLFSKS